MGVGRQEISSQRTVNQKSLELEIFFFLMLHYSMWEWILILVHKTIHGSAQHYSIQVVFGDLVLEVEIQSFHSVINYNETCFLVVVANTNSIYALCIPN